MTARYILLRKDEQDWDGAERPFWYIFDTENGRGRKKKHPSPVARFYEEKEANLSLEALNGWKRRRRYRV